METIGRPHAVHSRLSVFRQSILSAREHSPKMNQTFVMSAEKAFDD